MERGAWRIELGAWRWRIEHGDGTHFIILNSSFKIHHSKFIIHHFLNIEYRTPNVACLPAKAGIMK